MKEKSTSQVELLRLMGRKQWEISVIDKADEDFCLLHYKKRLPDGKEIHYFDKFVVIYLASNALRVLASIVKLDFDKVRYTHKLVANNVEKKHADDEKRFGQCSSRTSWEQNHDGYQGFTIRWYIGRGVLKVFHFVNHNGFLQVEMEMTTPAGKKASAVKIYERHELTEVTRKHIAESPHHQDLQ